MVSLAASVLFTVQKALPLLTDGASVILTSYHLDPGHRQLQRLQRQQAAVRNFARSWALDLKDRGIRVNAVSPGPIRTPGLGGLVSDEARQGLFDFLASQVPLGRLGEASEIGRAVALVASDATSFINGIEHCLSTAAWRETVLRWRLRVLHEHGHRNGRAGQDARVLAGADLMRLDSRSNFLFHPSHLALMGGERSTTTAGVIRRPLTSVGQAAFAWRGEHRHHDAGIRAPVAALAASERSASET